MKRPHVVCHMMGTVDGRILTERWSLSPAAEKQYEAVHALHQADAWMCGRKTFQGDFMDQTRDATFPRKGKVPPGDFIAEAQRPARGARRAKRVYAIAVDPAGKSRWDSSEMRGDQLVVLTTGRAPAGYRADLRAKGISYLIAGDKKLDFALALRRLAEAFGIRKVMLEGGGSINGSVLAADLVDEISLLVCPFADGARGEPSVLDRPEGAEGKQATEFRLMAVTKRPGDVVWLRYRRK